jgi:hypothetical protein
MNVKASLKTSKVERIESNVEDLCNFINDVFELELEDPVHDLLDLDEERKWGFLCSLEIKNDDNDENFFANKRIYDECLQTKEPFGFSLHEHLMQLCARGFIESGNYLIDLNC